MNGNWGLNNHKLLLIQALKCWEHMFDFLPIAEQKRIEWNTSFNFLIKSGLARPYNGTIVLWPVCQTPLPVVFYSEYHFSGLPGPNQYLFDPRTSCSHQHISEMSFITLLLYHFYIPLSLSFFTKPQYLCGFEVPRNI